MKNHLAFFFVLLITASAFGAEIPPLRPLKPDIQSLADDLRLILKKAKLEERIQFAFKGESLGGPNRGLVLCHDGKAEIFATMGPSYGQIVYKVLREMGFLFPHPRIQISPTWSRIEATCGKSFDWKPAVRYSGFHLHTLHPNEWVHGFLMGEGTIAEDTVRWLARNQQNVFDLSLLDEDTEEAFTNLKKPFALAKSLGIHTGVAVGFTLYQQNSYRLIPIFASLFDEPSRGELNRNLLDLLSKLDLSFINIESGSSEFTSTNFERTLMWMNEAARIAKAKDVATLFKIHVSTGQIDAKYGNFNFLASQASPDVGILPHTVYLYPLEADSAPMYGNKDFSGIRQFMVEESSKRRTWLYPETSYYCALDVDVPLLLTDYLTTRARDFAFAAKHGVDGHLNFSSGQEMGYWLFDWTTALLNDRDFSFDPLAGLVLLGEDRKQWEGFLDYQHRMIVETGVIGSITGTEVGSELFSSFHTTLKKNMLGQLANDPELLSEELENLGEANEERPSIDFIKNEELRRLAKVTLDRIDHAMFVRGALQQPDVRTELLISAAEIREKAQLEIDAIMRNFSRYSQAKLFERHANPTSYPYGYLYPVGNLHYWEREEHLVKTGVYGAFHGSLLSIWDVLSGPVL